MGEGFGAAMRVHLEEVERVNAVVLDEVAQRAHDVIAADGLIYTAGSGHSLALVLETFYRAGGLACIRPLYHAGLMPLAGGTESTLIERLSGLAASILDRVQPSEGDLAVIFSNSGANPVPVELATHLVEAGLTVVAVTSLRHVASAPKRTDRNLAGVAHHLIDTRVPPGDAAYPVGGGARTAGLSTLVGVYVWNLLLSRLADLADERGTELPLWASANLPGGDRRNRDLLRHYRPRIPEL